MEDISGFEPQFLLKPLREGPFQGLNHQTTPPIGGKAFSHGSWQAPSLAPKLAQPQQTSAVLETVAATGMGFKEAGQSGPVSTQSPNRKYLLRG